MAANRLWIVPFFVVLITISGCVREAAEGDRITFTYELWVPMVAVVIGVAATVLGWMIRNKAGRKGWGLVIVAPIATILLAPGLYGDIAVLDKDSFHLRTGIWSMTAVHDVRFDDVTKIRITTEVTTGRRGRNVNHYFVCERKDGTQAKIPIVNQLVKGAAPLILAIAQKREIPVIDETGGQ